MKTIARLLSGAMLFSACVTDDLSNGMEPSAGDGSENGDYVFTGVSFSVNSKLALLREAGCATLNLLGPQNELGDSPSPDSLMKRLSNFGSKAGVFECGGPTPLRFLVRNEATQLSVSAIGAAIPPFVFDRSDEEAPADARGEGGATFTDEDPRDERGQPPAGAETDDPEFVDSVTQTGAATVAMTAAQLVERMPWFQQEVATVLNTGLVQSGVDSPRNLRTSADHLTRDQGGRPYNGTPIGRPLQYDVRNLGNSDLGNGTVCNQTSYKFLTATMSTRGAGTGDDCGHMLGRQLGGLGTVDRTAPEAAAIFSQNASVNQHQVGPFESNVKKIIELDAANRTANVNIELKFKYGATKNNQSQLRPDGYWYTVSCLSASRTVCSARLRTLFPNIQPTALSIQRFFDNPYEPTKEYSVAGLTNTGTYTAPPVGPYVSLNINQYIRFSPRAEEQGRYQMAFSFEADSVVRHIQLVINGTTLTVALPTRPTKRWVTFTQGLPKVFVGTSSFVVRNISASNVTPLKVRWFKLTR
jgi:hypothetical protein